MCWLEGVFFVTFERGKRGYAVVLTQAISHRGIKSALRCSV